MCRGWMSRYPYFSSASRSQHVQISVSIAQRSVTAAVEDALCFITCRSADEVSGCFYVVFPALLFEMDAMETPFERVGAWGFAHQTLARQCLPPSLEQRRLPSAGPVAIRRANSTSSRNAECRLVVETLFSVADEGPVRARCATYVFWSILVPSCMLTARQHVTLPSSCVQVGCLQC
jgi:hypothetical protein